MLVIVSWVSFWLDKDAVPARVSLGVTTLLTMTTQASGINAKLPPVSYTKAVDVWIGACMGFIFGALLEFALVNYAGRMEFMEKEKQSKRSRRDTNSLLMLKEPVQLQMPNTSLIPVAPVTTDIPPPPPEVETAGCPECEAESHNLPTEFMHHNTAMADVRLPSTYYDYDMRPLMSSPLDLQAGTVRLKRRKHGGSGCQILHSFLNRHWYTEKSKRIDNVSRLVFPMGFFFFNAVYWSVYLSAEEMV